MRKHHRKNLLTFASLVVTASVSACLSLPVLALNNSNPVPTSVNQVGEYGEDIYDAAKANDWKQAATKLAALKQAANRLDTDIKSEDPNEDRLDGSIATLNRAVPAKQQLSAMREANQVTLLAAKLAAPFHLQVPVQVNLLDYYGRQLEVGVMAKDMNQLRTTANDIYHTWSAIRPMVESRGGSVEAQKFSNLVARVKVASPTEYSRLTTAVLDEVDNLEKVFEK